ncbi:hypothetical protein [Yeosuana marina]|nr:hypothetical protein [Yeosuana marina]
MSAHNCRVGKIVPNSDIEFNEDIMTHSKNGEDLNDDNHLESLD